MSFSPGFHLSKDRTYIDKRTAKEQPVPEYDCPFCRERLVYLLSTGPVEQFLVGINEHLWDHGYKIETLRGEPVAVRPRKAK